MSLPQTKPDPQRMMARLNDHAARAAYRAALEKHVAGAAGPVHALVISPTAAAELGDTALTAGCAAVTVVEPDADTLRLVGTLLRRRHPADKVTLIHKHPVQLPADAGYDVVVHDLFGPQLNTRSAGVVLRDLVLRRVVRGPNPRVIPAAGTMTARLYWALDLGVDTRVLDGPVTLNETGTVYPVPPGRRIGGTKWPDEVQLGISLAQALPISERVEVLTEVYDTADDPAAAWPSHITLLPTHTEADVARCVVALEWAVDMGDGQGYATGTAVGHDKQLGVANRRARALGWGRACAEYRCFADRLEPLHLQVDCRAAGGIGLSRVDAVPTPIPTKVFTNKKVGDATAATFAKLA